MCVSGVGFFRVYHSVWIPVKKSHIPVQCVRPTLVRIFREKDDDRQHVCSENS